MRPNRRPPFHPDANEVLHDSRKWKPISRGEAFNCLWQVPVAILSMQFGRPNAKWFDSSSPYYSSAKPYDYTGLRYFAYLGRDAHPVLGKAGGTRSKPQEAKAEDSDSVPLEDKKDSPSLFEPRRISLRVQGREEDGLRFDLAIDPEQDNVRGDVFLLKGLDSSYSQSRTVKDDRIPGEDRLTLLFPGVEEGKRYALSQVHQGEEAVLVPSLVFQGSHRAGPSASASSQAARRPAHVVGIKVVFRECRLLGETQDLWDREDTKYPIQLDFVKDKWVYVFGGPPGGAMRLIGEYLGTQEGRFRTVALGKSRGQDRRNPVSAAMDWLTLPLKVGDQKLDLFACLSPVQLPWKRVAALEADPRARCYHIGDGVGGVCWMPDKAAVEIRNLLKSKDPRIEHPGEDVVLFGLIDYLHEARRRAEQYQEHVKPYLESRFDPPRPGETTEQMDARRRKKYVAGLVKLLVDTSPEEVRRVKLKRALKDWGKGLEDYLLQEDSYELGLKKKAEACGAALVKWMDHPARGFEEALADWISDPRREELWEKAREEYAYLIQHFDVTSLTRLYGAKIHKDKTAWVNRYILGEDGFAAHRKTTQAAVEILAWMGRVVTRSDSFQVESLEKLCGVFFPGIRLEWVQYETARIDTWHTDLFQDETQAPRNERKVYFHSLEAPGLRQELKVLRVSKSTKPLEEMGHVAESQVTKFFLLGGLEAWNCILAAKQAYQEWKNNSSTLGTGINLAGSFADAGTLVGDTVKFGKRQLGRGFLSLLGVFSGICDTIAAGIDATDEATEGDYDAMAAKALSAAGSASATVGFAMVSYTVYTTMSGGLLWAGEGISLTGAGAPVGAALVLAGMMAQAAGAMVYLFADDTPVEEWMKNCPLGTHPEWDFAQASEAKKNISRLHALLFPYTVSAEHQYLTASNYAFVIKGTFQSSTRVKVRSFRLVDKEGRALTLLHDEVLEEGLGKPYRLQFIPGKPTHLHVLWNDAWCWDQHRRNHPGAPNGFKSCKVELEIDVNGDGDVLWPLDQESEKKLTIE